MWFPSGGPLLLNATAFEELTVKLIAALTLSLLTLSGCAAEPLAMDVWFRASDVYSVEELDAAAASTLEELGYIPVRHVVAGEYRARLAGEGDPRYVEVRPAERAEVVWSHVYRDRSGRAQLCLDLIVRHDPEAAQRIKDELAAELVLRLPRLDFPVTGWTGLGYDPTQAYSPLAIPGRAK